jgi:endonuclease/exonuclease/phosphatase family metal-dependent hydrolase
MRRPISGHMKESPVRKEKKDKPMKNGRLIIAVFVFLLTDLMIPASGQERTDSLFRMMFYNTENLFDTYNDSLTDDDEFLPGGTRRWTQTRYRQKINSICKVIIASGSWQPPAVIGLCEIENRGVLESLIYDTPLSKYNYGIIHFESSDTRGIDLGIIYRRDIFKALYSGYLVPGNYSPGQFRTRGVLYVKFLAAGDTVHLFLNHWPSRRGGVLAGESDRRNIALMVRNKADSVCNSVRNSARIIIAGDFNCGPDDSEIRLLAGNENKKGGGLKLVNLSAGEAGKGKGTYKYRGTWEMIDQVLVSEAFLSSTEGLMAGKGSLRIISDNFLLANDDSYAGMRPFSTYSGYNYRGGFSDHLPVVLELRLRSPDR